MVKESVSVRWFACNSIFILLLCTHVNAQSPDDGPALEIEAGAGTVIYQSAFATENITGIEVALRGGLNNIIQWQSGARLWIDPTSTEVFGRILFTQQRGSWSPFAGIELGITGKSKFGDGSVFLRETRNAMLTDAGPFYLSSHIAPLSFKLKKDWRISVAEINFGTHFKNFGRTLRLQLNIVSLGKAF